MSSAKLVQVAQLRKTQVSALTAVGCLLSLHPSVPPNLIPDRPTHRNKVAAMHDVNTRSLVLQRCLCVDSMHVCDSRCGSRSTCRCCSTLPRKILYFCNANQSCTACTPGVNSAVVSIHSTFASAPSLPGHQLHFPTFLLSPFPLLPQYPPLLIHKQIST
jgi:hypothetical protein